MSVPLGELVLTLRLDTSSLQSQAQAAGQAAGEGMAGGVGEGSASAVSNAASIFQSGFQRVGGIITEATQSSNRPETISIS